jgi:hypothetical protein
MLLIYLSNVTIEFSNIYIGSDHKIQMSCRMDIVITTLLFVDLYMVEMREFVFDISIIQLGKYLYMLSVSKLLSILEKF